jgi:hypothetical protein
VLTFSQLTYIPHCLQFVRQTIKIYVKKLAPKVGRYTPKNSLEDWLNVVSYRSFPCFNFDNSSFGITTSIVNRASPNVFNDLPGYLLVSKLSFFSFSLTAGQNKLECVCVCVDVFSGYSKVCKQVKIISSG